MHSDFRGADRNGRNATAHIFAIHFHLAGMARSHQAPRRDGHRSSRCDREQRLSGMRFYGDVVGQKMNANLHNRPVSLFQQGFEIKMGFDRIGQLIEQDFALLPVVGNSCRKGSQTALGAKTI